MENKLFLIFLLLSSCASSSLSSQPYFVHSEKIVGIAIGSPASWLKQKLGEPDRKNSEKFPRADYVVWEYGPDTKPIGYFTLDPKGQQVVGKAIWVYETDPEYDLNSLLKRYFPMNHFDKYIPCRQRGDEQVLIDQKNGIFVASRDQKTGLVSWSDPQLTQLRVNQFYVKCPQLQEPKRNGGY